MKKNDFKLVKTSKEEKVNKSPKKKYIITERMIKHLENENLKLRSIHSETKYAKVVFEYIKQENIKIEFEFELIEETIIFEFNGEKLTDKWRIFASKLYEEIIESLRFVHKDKEWSLSRYYIGFVEEYEKRKSEEFLNSITEEIKKIDKRSQIEAMSEENRFFFDLEDIHHLSFYITGEDGLKLIDLLKEMKLVTYQKLEENLFEIELIGKDKGIDRINRKIVFARELAKMGYNTWVDYDEDQ